MMRQMIMLIFLSFLLFACTSENNQNNHINDSEESSWKSGLGNLSIYPEDHREAKGTVMDKFCQVENENDTCNLQPSDPRDLLKEQEGGFTLRVEQEEGVILHLDYLTAEIPKPDQFTVTQFSQENENGDQLELQKNEDGYPLFLAPKEEGKYYYSVLMEWEDHNIREAYYAFSLHVK